MIPKIAWRNIWRNRLRSLVVISAIIVGVWSGIFVISLSKAIENSRAKTQLENFTSHIQIHDEAFANDQKLNYVIQNENNIENVLKKNKAIVSYCKRYIISEAMLETTKGVTSLELIGINPKEERTVTKMYDKIIDGTYFSTNEKNQVIIGKRLANKYDLETGDRMLIKFTNIHGTQVAKKFRISGIFETVDMQHDLRTVYAKNADLWNLLNIQPAYHEIAILTNNHKEAQNISESLKKEIKAPNQVEYWGEVSPDLGYADEMMDSMLLIVMSIFMVGLLFGIINTMLMAVLERTRELGMLMSIGMNKIRVALMIMFETLFLALVGGPIGILLSYLTIQYFGKVGIDLSIVGEGMNSFGSDSVIYPILETGSYPEVAVMVIITSLVASIFPARRALKLKPAEAVRAI